MYLVVATVATDGVTVGQSLELSIGKNGSGGDFDNQVTSTDAAQMVSITRIMSLNARDYLTIQVGSQDGSGFVGNATAGGTTFRVAAL
jgi:hypothetical protein